MPVATAWETGQGLQLHDGFYFYSSTTPRYHWLISSFPIFIIYMFCYSLTVGKVQWNWGSLTVGTYITYAYVMMQPMEVENWLKIVLASGGYWHFLSWGFLSTTFTTKRARITAIAVKILNELEFEENSINPCSKDEVMKTAKFPGCCGYTGLCVACCVSDFLLVFDRSLFFNIGTICWSMHLSITEFEIGKSESILFK